MEPNEPRGPFDPPPPSVPPPSVPPPPDIPPGAVPPAGAVPPEPLPTVSDIPGSSLPPFGVQSKEERTWAMATHLSALLVLILPTFGNVIGPLVVWLIKRDTMPFVAQEGKEALNFQLTQTIILLGCLAVTFLTCGIGGFIGGPIAVADVVFLLVMSVIAAIQANEGQAYRYPLTWRMIT